MLLLDSSVCGLFKWRQFEPEVILLAVGWYLRFALFPLIPRRRGVARRAGFARPIMSPSGGGCRSYAPEMERRLRSKLKQCLTDRLERRFNAVLTFKQSGTRQLS